jgi:bifunctional DNA-binding transcriptional regulator/antitoxin component of YhaV-PrlF toxin-antitoxin module
MKSLHYLFTVRIHKRGGSLMTVLPPTIRRHLGLRRGDLLDLLITEDGQVVLQTHPGASEKDLLRRGQVFAHQGMKRAEAALPAARQAGYDEGYFRRASEDLFRAPMPVRTVPPRGRRGRG